MNGKSSLLSRVIVILLATACLPANAKTLLAPETTWKFLEFCEGQADYCSEFVKYLYEMDLVGGTLTYCYPQSTTGPEEGSEAVYRRIRKWIVGHTETLDEDTEVSVRAALEALYPCRR